MSSQPSNFTEDTYGYQGSSRVPSDAQPDQPRNPGPQGSSQAVSPARTSLLKVREEVGKAVVGQDPTVTGLLIALLCGGHVLLEGVPGVAKTLLVRAFSTALSLETKRVQFTPDLMPGDVTGSLVYDSHTSEFSFREGPVFTNILLADEINRTPPKTQASLLEAMEEHQVSVDGVSRPLPAPFIVAATQNPVEYEGTYPLPEAQLDRFLLKLTMPLPGRNDEIEVIRRHAAGFDPRDLAAAGVRPVAGGGRISGPRSSGLHRRYRSRHPGRPVVPVGRLPPRCHGPPEHVQGLGLAVGADVRDPRRRQSTVPALPSAPRGPSPGGPDGRHPGGRRPGQHPLIRPGPALRLGEQAETEVI